MVNKNKNRFDSPNLNHDKQNNLNPKVKIKVFQNNQKSIVRNYFPEVKWKIDRIIARKLYKQDIIEFMLVRIFGKDMLIK